MTEMKNEPHIDIDPINKLMYVRFRDGICSKTIEFSPAVLVDVSKTGDLLGIEFLELDVTRKTLHALAKRFHNPFIRKLHPKQAAAVFA